MKCWGWFCWVLDFKISQQQFLNEMRMVKTQNLKKKKRFEKEIKRLKENLKLPQDMCLLHGDYHNNQGRQYFQ